ncbi:unnamed protein product [Darwinula stevensoni]|uniref:UDP-D-xylose:beta-D-glucoside alpha-1,3-D-xylosyltransferase n=1 Tax=Darwinula stevensoni TaxID=69355 RepID=A0A7R9A6R5_9CRUS|nr:unnamed protein product [Darwinula stevensoni]CAG0888672.1 unnamed protein product [Darwinula stevensoni]
MSYNDAKVIFLWVTPAQLLLYLASGCFVPNAMSIPEYWVHPTLTNANLTSEPVLVLSACGKWAAEEAMESLRSVVLFTQVPFRCIVVADRSATKVLKHLRGTMPPHVRFEIMDLTMHLPWWERSYVEKLQHESCTRQRLYLPDMLPDVHFALYVDTDTLFFAGLEEVWKDFNRLEASHLMSLTLEHETTSQHSAYQNWRRIPFYGQTGVQAGITFLNLDKMRSAGWVNEVQEILREYNAFLQLVEQDVINIYGHRHPEAFNIVDCRWNYRYLRVTLAPLLLCLASGLSVHYIVFLPDYWVHPTLMEANLTSEPVLVITACGKWAAEEALQSLRSVVLFTQVPFRCIVVADWSATKVLQHLRGNMPPHVRFEIMGLHKRLPWSQNPYLHKLQHEPCKWLRLYLPDMLPDVHFALYVDTDTLFFVGLEEVWKDLNRLESSHLMSITLEHEITSEHPAYQDQRRVPFYGQTGVQAGVTFLDLEKMRSVGSEHCQAKENSCPPAERNGIGILHGAGNAFNNFQYPEISTAAKVFQEWDPRERNASAMAREMERRLARLANCPRRTCDPQRLHIFSKALQMNVPLVTHVVPKFVCPQNIDSW